MRFMQGRYGVDPFCKFLLIAGLVVVFLSAVLGGSVVGMILYVIGWILIIYCYFRMFSRNISRRYAENQAFLAKTYGIAVSSGNRRIYGSRGKTIISIHVPAAGRRSAFREEKAG